MWVMWDHVLHGSGTVCMELERVATPLPAALLLLLEVTVVAETMCLQSYCLETAVSLAPVFRLSGVMS
jgi:hypothetical protein